MEYTKTTIRFILNTLFIIVISPFILLFIGGFMAYKGFKKVELWLYGEESYYD